MKPFQADTRRTSTVAILLTLTLAAGLLGACTSEPAATKTDEIVLYQPLYPSYDTVDDLLDTADLVVRGTPTADRTEQVFMDASVGNDPNANPQAGLSSKEREKVRKESGTIVTVSAVKVLEVVKGAVAVGDTIEVSQLGGSFEGAQYQGDGTTLLSKDGEYVLFLAAKDAAPYQLLNPEQAMYTVSAGGKLAKVSQANSIDIGRLASLRKAAAAR